MEEYYKLWVYKFFLKIKIQKNIKERTEKFLYRNVKKFCMVTSNNNRLKRKMTTWEKNCDSYHRKRKVRQPPLY